MTYALMRPLRFDLDALAHATGTHPELIRRFVALGLLDAERDVSGALWFSPGQVAAVGRIRRLRAVFSLNYASVGLVCDLLDRIAELETARHFGERSWISSD